MFVLLVLVLVLSFLTLIKALIDAVAEDELNPGLNVNENLYVPRNATSLFTRRPKTRRST